MKHAPLKRLVSIFSGTGFPTRLQGDPSQEIPFLKVGSLSTRDKRGRISTSVDTVSTKTAVGLGAALVPEGSSLMAKIGAATYLRRVAQNASTCCIDNNMMALVPTEGADPRYVYYLLHTVDVHPIMNPGAVPNLDMDAFRHHRVNFLSLAAQRSIADYLDHEIAEIDAFIADQNLLADLALEYQWSRLSSVINYPEEFASLWDRSEADLVSLKHLGTITLGKMLDPVKPGAAEYGQQYLRAANVQPMGILDLGSLKSMRFTEAERTRLDLQTGDVAIVEGGIGGYGRAAYLKQDLRNIGFQNSIVRFRPHKHVDGRYITYALLLLRRIGYIEAVASVASMPHFTAEKVAETPIPIINRDKQQQIADELDDTWQSAADLDDDLHQAIDLARERRAALISAAVTGQIDVTQRHKPVAEVLEDEVGVRA